MARAVERIERDIAVLQEALSAIAAELQSTYASYLTALGQAVRQQLVLASYQVCTQGYPQAFLSLSVSQRQQLQQAIRNLGQQATDQLLALVKPDEEDLVQETDGEMGTELDTSNLDVDSPPYPCIPASPPHSRTPTPYFSNPGALAQWQQKLELAITHTLKTVSRDANRLLQQVNILPNKLPEQLMEASTTSEASAEAMPGPPNLLNLFIDEPDEESESAMTQIIAINLRLSELEFADATVRAGRVTIRNLLVKATKVGREYHKKQRERAVVAAEAAWRASWFEEF